MSLENVEIVRAAFGAFGQDDWDAFIALVDPEIEWVTTGQFVGGPVYFEALDEAWANLRIEIEDYRGLGDSVVAIGCVRGTGKSSGVQVEEPFAVLFVIRDSVFVRVDSYSDPSDALEAAWLSE